MSQDVSQDDAEKRIRAAEIRCMNTEQRHYLKDQCKIECTAIEPMDVAIYKAKCKL